MARKSLEIISMLRKTAQSIASSNDYQWGHMGACNCGFLAQEISHLQKNEIHKRAMERYGDWYEQLNDYCPSSGFLMDDLISEILTFGFDVDDLKHLEKLSDARILRSLPVVERNLRHNVKGDVVKYMLAWASLLEYKLLSRISITLNESVPVGSTIMQ
jgi:hypothetical protein